jgi:F-box protein 10
MEHSTLKSALAVANDYDRIEVYPGIYDEQYDEQFEMSSKIPFELIGVGELGST